MQLGTPLRHFPLTGSELWTPFAASSPPRTAGPAGERTGAHGALARRARVLSKVQPPGSERARERAPGVRALTPAVHLAQVREAPNVAQAHGVGDAGEDELQRVGPERSRLRLLHGCGARRAPESLGVCPSVSRCVSLGVQCTLVAGFRRSATSGLCRPAPARPGGGPRGAFGGGRSPAF